MFFPSNIEFRPLATAEEWTAVGWGRKRASFPRIRSQQTLFDFHESIQEIVRQESREIGGANCQIVHPAAEAHFGQRCSE